MSVYTGHHNIKCISYIYHYYCNHTCEMSKHYTLTCISLIMKAVLNVLINVVRPIYIRIACLGIINMVKKKKKMLCL